MSFFFQNKKIKAAKAIAKECKRATQEPLPQLSPSQVDARKKILASSAKDLAASIKAGTLSSYDVVLTFCHRAQQLDVQVNCLTESFFPQALNQAKYCDQVLASLRKKGESNSGLGVLFGVPVTIKEEFEVAGARTTLGVVDLSNNVISKDGLIVRQFVESTGAIIIAHTNVPQLLMTFETDNRMWGRTLNPWNHTRTCGGSSGGEGAVIAGGGSPLGLGSDIGGSIRIPSHFCGIYGVKPTQGRVTHSGEHDAGIATQVGVPATPGPMARHAEDLALILRCLFNPPESIRDPLLPPLGFREELYQSRKSRPALRIGVLRSCDEVFPAAPPCSRAVDLAVEALRAAGHTIVEWKPPTPFEVIRLALSFFSGDGLKSAYKALNGEPLLPQYRSIGLAASLPRFLLYFVSSLMNIAYLPQSAAVATCIQEFSAFETQQLHADALHYRREVVESMKQLDIDILLLPSFGTPAIPLDFAEHLTETTWYTLFANVCQLPAGTCPVTTVQNDEQIYPLLDSKIEWGKRDAVRKTVENSAGLPVGVQVVGKPFEDELVLRVMQEIAAALPAPRLDFA